MSITASAGAQVYLSTTDHTIGDLVPISYFTVAGSGSYGFNCADGRAFCAYNGNGDPTTGFAASGTSSFVFNSGVFAAKAYEYAAAPTSITFIGIDGVSTFTSTPCTLSATTFTFCANSFTNSITSLIFKTAAGETVLLGTGLIGLVPIVRRKLKK